jgi:hypothetical protein
MKYLKNAFYHLSNKKTKNANFSSKRPFSTNILLFGNLRYMWVNSFIFNEIQYNSIKK